MGCGGHHPDAIVAEARRPWQRLRALFDENPMYLVAIAWIYVTLMMAIAEATSPTGSILGAIVTFTLYGALPLSIVMYILGTPGRKKARRAREAQEHAAWQAGQPMTPPDSSESAQPDAGREAAAPPQTQSVAPVRKEP